MGINNPSDLGLSKILEIDRKTLTAILQGEDFKMSHAIRIAAHLDIKLEVIINNFTLEQNNNHEIIEKETLFLELDNDNLDLSSLLDDNIIQDPETAYSLFYDGIQKFILNLLPKGDPRIIVLELKLFYSQEKKNNI